MLASCGFGGLYLLEPLRAHCLLGVHAPEHDASPSMEGMTGGYSATDGWIGGPATGP